MRYLYIPVALIVIFIIYLLHTLFVEKDKKKIQEFSCYWPLLHCGLGSYLLFNSLEGFK